MEDNSSNPELPETIQDAYERGVRENYSLTIDFFVHSITKEAEKIVSSGVANGEISIQMPLRHYEVLLKEHFFWTPKFSKLGTELLSVIRRDVLKKINGEEEVNLHRLLRSDSAIITPFEAKRNKHGFTLNTNLILNVRTHEVVSQNQLSKFDKDQKFWYEFRKPQDPGWLKVLKFTFSLALGAVMFVCWLVIMAIFGLFILLAGLAGGA